MCVFLHLLFLGRRRLSVSRPFQAQGCVPPSVAAVFRLAALLRLVAVLHLAAPLRRGAAFLLAAAFRFAKAVIILLLAFGCCHHFIVMMKGRWLASSATLRTQAAATLASSATLRTQAAGQTCPWVRAPARKNLRFFQLGGAQGNGVNVARLDNDLDNCSGSDIAFIGEDLVTTPSGPVGEWCWRVGRACGGWVGRHHPLLEQGRVLLVNARVTLSRVLASLPKQV